MRADLYKMNHNWASAFTIWVCLLITDALRHNAIVGQLELSSSLDIGSGGQNTN